MEKVLFILGNLVVVFTIFVVIHLILDILSHRIPAIISSIVLNIASLLFAFIVNNNPEDTLKTVIMVGLASFSIIVLIIYSTDCSDLSFGGFIGLIIKCGISSSIIGAIYMMLQSLTYGIFIVPIVIFIIIAVFFYNN